MSNNSPIGSFDAPLKAAKILADFKYLWGICGGWAIDLYLGRVTRRHKDVDIAILRRDQLALQGYLSSKAWILKKAFQGVFTTWANGELIEPPVHTIWCRNPDSDPGFIEILFNEADDQHFLFRRDCSIRLTLDLAFQRSNLDLPILAPEIVLLYKAKYVSDEENNADFYQALPYLDPASRAWLKAALFSTHTNHEWIENL